MTTISASEIDLVSVDDIERAARALAGVACARRSFLLDAITEARGRAGLRSNRKCFSAAARSSFAARTLSLAHGTRERRERRHRAVVGQSRAGSRARRKALRRSRPPSSCRRPSRSRKARRRRAARRARRAGRHDDGRSHERRRRSWCAKGVTLVPPYDRSGDHRRPGHGRTRDRGRPARRRARCSFRSAAADSAPASRRRSSCALPNARVIGVEPTGAPKLSRARAAGKPVQLEHSGGLADGLLAVEIGRVTFAHHQRYLDDVVTVDDDGARAARCVCCSTA